MPERWRQSFLPRYGSNLPRIGSLGVLSPAVQTSLQAQLSNIEALHAQAIFDLRTLGDQGEDVSAMASEAEALSISIAQVQAEIMTADDAQESALRQTLATLEGQAQDLISRTGGQRQGVVERAQFTGLWWGLGVVAAVGLAAWFVWDQRKRRRR